MILEPEILALVGEVARHITPLEVARFDPDKEDPERRHAAVFAAGLVKHVLIEPIARAEGGA